MIRDFLYNYKQNSVGRLRYHSTNTVTEPITLAEAKTHLRVEDTNDDTYITALISASRSICEQYVGFMLARNSKMNYFLDRFPQGEVIYIYGVWIPGSVAISYYDTTDTQVIWASGYNKDEHSRPARIFLEDSSSYPDTSENIPSGINIDMTNCGPIAVDLPKAIHQAILLTIGHLYENRQNVVVGSGKPYDVPQTSEHLLNPFRIVEV